MSTSSGSEAPCTASRRGMLSLAGAAAAWATVGAGLWPSPAASLIDLLRALITDREAAQALAAHYLRTTEGDWRRRLDALTASAPRDLAELRGLIDEARRADLEREDLAIVDGWVLARSEAETLVLATLTA